MLENPLRANKVDELVGLRDSGTTFAFLRRLPDSWVVGSCVISFLTFAVNVVSVLDNNR